jgi:hypothetical protein
MKQIFSTIALTLTIFLTVSAAIAGPSRWSGNQKNTAGWQLMSEEERGQHQTKLRSFTEYALCKEYVDEHHKKMEERAKEKGVDMPVMRHNPCDAMKGRGQLK